MNIKILLILAGICFLLASAAHGQNYNNFRPNTQMDNNYWPPDHSWHADYHNSLTYRDLREPSSVYQAQGERFAWEFPWPSEKPLGDVARENREHMKNVPKAKIVWTP